MSIEQVLEESIRASETYWFVQRLEVISRTDQTITLHFKINSNLFVQMFFSQRSGRYSQALIGTSGRLYGCDREHGIWHCHPFEAPEQHTPMPEGRSPQPIFQFLTEVEDILIENNLL